MYKPKKVKMRIYPKIAIIVLISFLIVSIPAPKAEAMEPISISLLIAALAPIVLPYVLKALPYVWKGFVNFASAMLDVGVEFARMGYLFLGFMECTIGIPFGLFRSGVKNVFDGSVAPFKAIFNIFLIPVKTVGLARTG